MLEISMKFNHYFVFSAVCTVLIIIGAYMSISIGAGVVPIVLQNMFVLFAALLLGPKWGFISVSVYLLLGALGLPVFAQVKGGFVHLIGPTGGFLLSYLPVSVVTGFISQKTVFLKFSDSIAVVLGIVLIYLIGVPWLKFNLNIDWNKAVAVGMLPFIFGDVLKGVAVIGLVRVVRPVIQKLIAGRE
jgi:biotin transport system substrate-specific component